MKQWIVLGTFVGCLGNGVAQNESDILRYSQGEVFGTLRNVGMGGAMGAVGADLSAGFSNPAGLGLYRRGDVGFNLGFTGAETYTAYEGLAQRASTGNAPMSNAGMAITYPSINPDWPFVTLAIAYQKRSEFAQQITSDGTTLNGSLLGLFSDQAQGNYTNSLPSFTAAPAWDTYLLDPDPASPACETCYVSAMDASQGARASKRIDRSGTLAETAISFAGNFRHRLFLGGTVGLPRVTFSEQTRHDELPLTDTIALTGWSYSEQLDIEGSGVNLRVGAIWAVADWMRLGANFATRSRLSLRDGFSTRINSAFNNGASYEASSPLNQFEYIIYTPSRVATQVAFIMGKAGIVTAEYERTDYRGGELRAAAFSGASAYDFDAENDVAQRIHTVSHAARVGAEFRIARDHRVRLGAGLTPSPYSQAAEVQTDATRYHGSLGWAYRSETWYGGFSYIMTVWDEDLYLWGVDGLDPAELHRQTGMFLLGIGARL